MGRMLIKEHEAVTLTPAAPVVDERASTRVRWLEVLDAFHRSAAEPWVVAIDAVIVAAAVILRGGTRFPAVTAALSFVAVGAMCGLYARRGTIESQGVSWYTRLLPLPLLAVAVALALDGNSRTRMLTAPVIGAAIFLVLLRGATWLVIARARRRRLGLRSVLLVGPPDRTGQVARRIEAYPEAGIRVAATYSPADTNGDRTRARTLLRSGGIAYILVTAETHDEALVEECVAWGKDSGTELGIILPVGTAAPGVSRLGDVSIVSLGHTQPVRHQAWAKRLVDIAVSSFLLLLLAPALAVVAAAIYVYDRGPIIYRQKRVGLDNREFMIWKFRSMVPNADTLKDRFADSNVAGGLLFKLPNDPRVTPVGNLIRRLSLDELPQLFNVLVGDMSLVGPRPLPVSPDDFDEVAARRHLVRPGITGPWQVCGGHMLGYDEMIKLDLTYVDSWSLRRDIWFLVMTIPAVLVRRSSAY
jgi:exopolysaccharide biosynthesis polyprenyl glycosylphosphotransferase